MESVTSHDIRSNKMNNNSNMLMNKLPTFDDDDLTRVWGTSRDVRVFISHRASQKSEATKIKQLLREIGISSFVAHEDISPTEAWQKEILIAFQSMDVLLAYISDDFSSSSWTNQEVGFALGKNIPILPFAVGANPEGFISFMQAKKYTYNSFKKDIIGMLTNTRIVSRDLHRVVCDVIISHFSDSYSFATASSIFELIENVEYLEQHQIRSIIDAFNANDQIHGSDSLNGYRYGKKVSEGRVCQKLNELTAAKFEVVLGLRGYMIQKKSV